MTSIFDKIYAQMPVMVQNLMISTYGMYWNRLRFGGSFQNDLNGFLERERWTKHEWTSYQTTKLRELLLYAYEKIPYYQEHWKGIANELQLSKFELTDLSALPPLEKSAVRDNPQLFLANGKPQTNHRMFHTSGSSGTPIETYWLPTELQSSLALREARSCKFAGVSYKMPRATFSGRIIEPNPNSKGPFYRFNQIENQVYFSAFHLRPENAEHYISALSKHEIAWITGYSNSIFQLSQMILDQKILAPKLQAVITTSEKLTQEMANIIQLAFSTNVFEEYGTVEELFYACANEFGQMLISPDAGILEVVDDDFRPQKDGKIGEVLATGFIRPSQPLIRYRVGDMAILSDEPAKCGRNMPVLKEVTGRIEDTVYGPDGRRTVRFHGVFVDQPNIQEAQIIQEAINLIKVRVVPKSNFNKNDELDIISRIQQRLTKEVNVIIEIIPEIPRTSSGKFKAVISKLSEEEKLKAGITHP